VEHLEYSSGSEYDPGDPFGRCYLSIDNGAAHLEVRHRGIRRTWTGRIGTGTLGAVDEHLAAAGFPAVPPHQVPAGSSLRTLTVGEGDDAPTARIAYHEASKLPGYAEAFALLDGVIAALTGGEVPVVAESEPDVEVTEARAEEAS